MPVIPRTRSYSLERIAGMWPCLHPALRKKKKRKKNSRTHVRNRSGWSCAFYVETSTSCSQRERGWQARAPIGFERRGVSANHKFTSPGLPGLVRGGTYGATFPVSILRRRNCRLRPRARSRKLTTVSVSKRFWMLFLCCEKWKHTPVRALPRQQAAPSSDFLLWQGRRPKLQVSMF